MIENWKELVGYEEIQVPHGWVHYLECSYSADSVLKIQVRKTEIECTLTEEELCNELDTILTSYSTSCIDNDIAINRAMLESVKKTRRGVPNTKYKNARYYKGTTSYDSPVIVGEFDGKFGIYLHPKFDDYGFIIQ